MNWMVDTNSTILKLVVTATQISPECSITTSAKLTSGGNPATRFHLNYVCIQKNKKEAQFKYKFYFCLQTRADYDRAR